MSTDDLLTRIQAHCDRTGINLTEFGKQAMNDTGFVSKLKNGRNITLKTLRRVERFMSEAA
jgi:hypothetical protein